MIPTRIRKMLPVLLLALPLPAAKATAQSVHGQVVEGTDARPVAGSLVVLLDERGRSRGGALTDEAGRFTLAAPAPGQYRVRAERVGHPSTLSDPLQLAAGDSREVRLAADSRGVSLEGITVEAASKACARADASLATATLWEEARKALASAEVATHGAEYRFEVAQYARSLEPGSLRVRSEERRTQSAASLRPFQSLPPDSLSRFGYVRRAADGTLYYGPDVRVLASPEFVDEHCFHVAQAAPGQPALVGLAFEPVRDRRLPDIAGTMWLDRATAELRYVEYRYANLHTQVPTAALGGRVEFEREPNGGWIVRRWRIRTPEISVVRRVDAMAVDRAAAGPRSETLTGIHENGGEVTSITTADGRAVGSLATAAITGTLRDAATGATVAGARVYISGTQYAAVTDAQGRFRLDGLGEGSYALSYVHPRLDSLAALPAPATVAVKPGDVAQVALELPAAPVRLAQGAARPAGGRSTETPAGTPAKPIPLDPVNATGRGGARSEFYQRAGRGQGVYITRQQIAAQHAGRTVDLLRRVPSLEVVGSTVRPRASGNQAPRGQATFGRNAENASEHSKPDCRPQPGVSTRQQAQAACEELQSANVEPDCQPALFIDGQPAPGGIADLNSVSPSEIEGIEIYARAATAPAQYKRLNSDCSIILMWTRQQQAPPAGSGSPSA
jgi:hypothetical protein